jgi:hypothetical protein
MTDWQVAAGWGRSLRAFASLLDNASSTRTQYKRFNRPSISWRPRDPFAQRLSLSITGNLDLSRYWVQFDLYDVVTNGQSLVLLSDGARI